MSGRERLQAHTAPRTGELLKRILVVVGLMAFLALGLALEGSQSSQRQARPPIKSNKKPSAALSDRFGLALPA